MKKIKPILVGVWTVLVEAYEGYSRDHGSHLAAAMAFYTVFALAPLTIIATAISGLIFGREASRTEVVTRVGATMGPEAREFLVKVLENWRDTSSGIIATVLGGLTTLYLAFRVFDALRESLSILWSIRPREDLTWRQMFRQWGRSAAMMLIVGPMLIGSIVVGEVLTRITPYIKAWTPIDIGSVTYMVIAFALLTFAFATIYKWLPDVHIAWRDVAFGAVVTAGLFTAGRALIALYMVHTSTASLFGAAASFVVLLFWVYYSAQILFFGAEITEVYAHRFGSGIEPDESSVRVDVPSGFEGERPTD